MNEKWYKESSVLVGLAVISVIAMLVIPVPAFLLDILISVSIMIGLVTLLTAMSSKANADLSVFPTLLLVTTVFRLALNVSSTRMILQKGPAFDGALIRAFGEFVVGGNYVIGVVVFLILILVQMMVITKGATRIGEVAARFSLDGMPVKQMSIDSDLTSGLITEEEARAKRESLKKEVDFYGQMDGATKFVQGDVRVGLIITAINLIGGFIIGVAMRGESITSALQTYTLFTVGDGLVAQIPSLLITTATGMVVTRAGAEKDLGEDLSSQLFRDPKVLWMVAGALAFSAILPGFPLIPLWSIAGGLGFLAYTITKGARAEDEKLRTQDERKERPANERFLDEIAVDPLRLEVGYNLISLVSQERGGTLLNRITDLRQKFAKDLGMIVPPIRINDNMDLDGNDYSILVSGIEVSKASAYPEKLAALDGGNVTEPMEGEPYKDPSFGLDAILIPEDKKNEAEEKGYILVDSVNIIITHLTEVLRDYATQIMGREEVKMLIDKMRERYPAVVDEVMKTANLGLVQQVLHNLLKENVSIRNMVAILETIADNIERAKDPVILTEFVRQKLGRQIVNNYLTDGALEAIQIDPVIENLLRSAITYDENEGRILAIDPHEGLKIRDAFIETFNNTSNKFPVFLAGTEIRTSIFMMLERSINARKFAVIAYEELPHDIQPKIISQVVVQEQEVEELV